MRQGETRPRDTVDATMRNASAIIVTILDDVGRRLQETHSQQFKGGRQGETKLDVDLEKHKAEFAAADAADVQLVEAVCLPALREGIRLLREVGPDATLPPLCAELLHVRDVAEGRSLLVLAAGAGVSSIVMLLLDIADLAPSMVKTDATSFHGSNALHEAAACEHEPTCLLLLQRTGLPLHGPAATKPNGGTPLTNRNPKFRLRLQTIDRTSADGGFYVCGRRAAAGDHPSNKILKRLLEEIHLASADFEEGSHSKAPIKESADFQLTKDAMRALSRSNLVLIFLTAELLKQPRVLLEIAAAYDNCSRVIGVILDDDAGVMSEPRISSSSQEGFVRLRRQSSFGKRDDPPLLKTLLTTLENKEHQPKAAKGTHNTSHCISRYFVPPELRGEVGDRVAETTMHKVRQTLFSLSPAHSPLAPLVLINQSEVNSDPEKIIEIAGDIVKVGKSVAPPQSALDEFKARQIITQFASRNATRRRFNARLTRKQQSIGLKRLRWEDGGDDVDVSSLLPLANDKCFHIFLSHDWAAPAGRDVMRLLKDRLLELFPMRIEWQRGNAQRDAARAKRNEEKRHEERRQVWQNTARLVANNAAEEQQQKPGAVDADEATAPAASAEEVQQPQHSSEYWQLEEVLKEVPRVSVFLDVDNLDGGCGAEYVQNSMLIVCYICETFFKSRSALRELFFAVKHNKRIIALMEADPAKGGIPKAKALNLLQKAHEEGYFKEAEVTLEEVQRALFELDPVEWERVLIYQESTVRQIVDRLLCPSVLGTEHRGATYVDGDRHAPFALPPPQLPIGTSDGGRGLPSCAAYHLYVSPHNLGAMALIQEMQALFPTLATALCVTDRLDDLGACSHMLLYLHEMTWDDTPHLAKDIEEAMRLEIDLILCHEGTTMCEPGEKRGCDFGIFLGERAVTPQSLLEKDVYKNIAAPLRQGLYRKPSLLNLVDIIASKVTGWATSQTSLAERRQVAGKCTDLQIPEDKMLAELRRQPSWAMNSAFRSTRDMMMACNGLNEAVRDRARKSSGSLAGSDTNG